MKTEGTNLFLLTISASWSSSRWPLPEGREVHHWVVVIDRLRCIGNLLVNHKWNTHVNWNTGGDISSRVIGNVSVDDLAPRRARASTGTGGRFKNTFELLNLRALRISMLYKIISFNVWVKYFVWIFKGYLWNSTQNILPIHWKMWISFTYENSRALRCKSS